MLELPLEVVLRSVVGTVAEVVDSEEQDSQ